MPTYEYACRKCGHEWEATQSIKDDPLEVCPKCGRSAAERQISAGTNFILKGGGWFADLYSSHGSTKHGAPTATPTPKKAGVPAPAAAPAKPSGAGSTH